MLLREGYIRCSSIERRSWEMVMAEGNNLAGSRILVVEDESALRLLLSEFLSDEGFDITEAESGDQAIKLLDTCETFDLVFTDISLPGWADGNAVADKAKERSQDIPVLYSSACKDSMRNRLGAYDAFLDKPCRLHDIISVVKRLLLLSKRRVPSKAPVRVPAK
jgi:two-component system, response regulator PdtaR